MGQSDDTTKVHSIPDLLSNAQEQSAYLIVISASSAALLGRMFKLDNRKTTLVGRGDQVQVQLEDDSISPLHAQVVGLGDGRFQLGDRGSTNGTYLNGLRVNTAPLYDGDKIQLGMTLLKFSILDGVEEAYQQRIYRMLLNDQQRHAAPESSQSQSRMPPPSSPTETPLTPSGALGTQRASISKGTGSQDIAILTVIQPELFAALDALGISPADRKKDKLGTLYFHGSVYSQLAKREYRLILACVGTAGNNDASAAAVEMLAAYQPQALVLMGIAAGIRGKTRIGEVVLSDRVVAYEPAAIVDAGRMESRPEVDRLPHAMNQDVVGYRPDPARLIARFRQAGGVFPAPLADQRDEFERYVASTITVRAATIASGEKLLRDPAKLLAVRREQHGKVEVGEMEAAGIVAACRRANTPWLVVRGISDFGDAFKDDRFHEFAARMSATILADFLAYGLDLSASATSVMERSQPGSASQHASSPSLEHAAAPTVAPTPLYLNEKIRSLSIQLEDARARRARLQSAGASTDRVDSEILNLRRQLREGGQLHAGDRLGDGRFLLVDIAGAGGFATVWKAFDHERSENVAIKVLHTNLAGDAQRRERFFRGARRMAELQHPAVVRVIEQSGEDGGYHYFVMEFISGGNFRQAVLDKSIPPDKVLSFIERIGGALALAHLRGIIHRDIKPSNILLDAMKNPLLTDFDLVGAADTTGGTRTGAMGTAVYAAPECLDRPQDADARADVYGLGMTAVFGLYGADLPFSFLRRPDTVLSRLPFAPSVIEVLRRATSWELEERYQDAGEFLKALQETRTSEPR